MLGHSGGNTKPEIVNGSARRKASGEHVATLTATEERCPDTRPGCPISSETKALHIGSESKTIRRSWEWHILVRGNYRRVCEVRWEGGSQVTET